METIEIPVTWLEGLTQRVEALEKAISKIDMSETMPLVLLHGDIQDIIGYTSSLLCLNKKIQDF